MESDFCPHVFNLTKQIGLQWDANLPSVICSSDIIDSLTCADNTNIIQYIVKKNKTKKNTWKISDQLFNFFFASNCSESQETIACHAFNERGRTPRGHCSVTVETHKHSAVHTMEGILQTTQSSTGPNSLQFEKPRPSFCICPTGNMKVIILSPYHSSFYPFESILTLRNHCQESHNHNLQPIPSQ